MRSEQAHEELYHTPEELAQRLKLSTATVYKLLANDELPYFKVGKCYRIPSRAFEAYMMREGNLARFIGPRLTVPQAAEAFVGLIEASSEELRKQVVAVVLFGSHARGEPDEGSDIDLLVLVTRCDSKVEGDIAALSTQAMAEGDYDEFLSPIRMSVEHWRMLAAEGSPLVDEIRREGVPLWPRGSRSLKDIAAVQKRS